MRKGYCACQKSVAIGVSIFSARAQLIFNFLRLKQKYLTQVELDDFFKRIK